MSNKKNWELMIIDNKTQIKEMAELVKAKAIWLSERIKEDYKEDFLNYTNSFYFFENAPLLILPIFRISHIFSGLLKTSEQEIARDIELFERDNYIKSISCVAMLVLLAAQSLGLGACYMTGPLIANNELKRIINIKPGKDIGAIIPVGYDLLKK
jgi:nitroreductase